MDYFKEKELHAYNCYKAGVPRKKVYAVVEKDDKFVVLHKERSKYKYSLAGGGIEDGEDIETAIKREALEELNMQVEVVKTLGVIKDKSKWNYEGFDFLVDDEKTILYTKYVAEGNNTTFGVTGEFGSQDGVFEISKEEMLSTVAEFVKYGLKL